MRANRRGLFEKGEKGVPLPWGFVVAFFFFLEFVVFITSTVGNPPSQCFSQSPFT